jgi:hypothetical protein
MELRIDPEFTSLIPPITQEEYDILEQSLLQEGCRDALVVWDDNFLLDGHHRFQICQKHDIPFKTISKSFEGREQAKEWMIRNQLGRRNLSMLDRGRLALLLKPIIEEKAREKQIQAGKEKLSQKSVEASIDTQKELAKIAGVSHDTIHKVEVIEKEATQEQKDQIANKQKSINKVYQEIKEKHPSKKEEKEKPSKPGSFEGIENDSNNLFHLKRYWRLASKRDRKKFLEWINVN